MFFLHENLQKANTERVAMFFLICYASWQDKIVVPLQSSLSWPSNVCPELRKNALLISQLHFSNLPSI